MKQTNALFVAAATAAALVALAPINGHAQASVDLVLAQMMHGDKGMQSQGMQGTAPMEGHGGVAGSTMQTPAAGPSSGSPPCGQQASGMQGHMMGGMGPGAMPGSGMSGSGMPSPQMMQQMMMMQGHMAELPTDRIEGRIAYLHAELRITEAQMPTFAEFANVLRANAKRMSDARLALSQAASKSAADRLDGQERWLAARLDSVRAVKAAYAKLHAVLDDSQKRSAEELVIPYMGVR